MEMIDFAASAIQALLMHSLFRVLTAPAMAAFPDIFLIVRDASFAIEMSLKLSELVRMRRRQPDEIPGY